MGPTRLAAGDVYKAEAGLDEDGADSEAALNEFRTEVGHLPEEDTTLHLLLRFLFVLLAAQFLRHPSSSSMLASAVSCLWLGR